MTFKAGDKVLMEISGYGEVDYTGPLTLVDLDGALHAQADDGDISPFPFDPETGAELGNPLADYGDMSARVIPAEEEGDF